MKPTEKQKCIAEQVVYEDLKVKYTDESTIWTLSSTALETNYEDLILPMSESYLPIFRPMSDLTKSIKHKGYNNDKAFIPIKEKGLALWNACVYGDGVIKSHNSTFYYYYFNTEENKYILLTNCPLNIDILDLLNQWHFDTRNLIEAGEAIDVNTCGINPYEL